MTERINVPVLVGVVPLFMVTSFKISEGYKTAPIAGSTLMQMLAPSTKTINIEALLIREFRAFRPALEAMALTSRVLAATAGLMQLTGIPVVTKNSVSVDMQITNLIFTQDNQMRDTLRVSMTLTHVPRTRLVEAIGGGLDFAVGIGTAFI